MNRLAGCSLLIAVGFLTLAAQSPPTFDSFSVKPAPPGIPTGYFGPRFDPVRFSDPRTPLSALIEMAYDLHDFQLTGGPAWIRKDLFSIEAGTAAPTDKPTMLLMLRQALSQRFHLVLTPATREGNVYSLTVLPGASLLGHQDMKQYAPAAIPSSVPVGSIIEFTMTSERYGDNGNNTVTHFNELRGDGTNTTELAQTLSGLLNAPVNDDTGIHATFDLGLKFAALSGTPDPIAPALPTALKEQLGLKLTRSHGSYPVYTIQQADHPTAD